MRLSAADTAVTGSRRRAITALLFSLLWLTVCGRATPAWADTDHLRELAKNKPRTLIVASGKEALPLAEAFQSAVRRREEFRKRNPDDARVVTPAEAETLLKTKEYARTSVVMLMTGHDLSGQGVTALPPSLATLLPFENATLHSRLSVVKSVLDAQKAGEPLFRMALYAPDGPRLRRLYDEMLNRRVGNFRELPFISKHVTNRVALFSTPALRPLLENWGARGDAQWWNEVRWYPLEERAKLTPEQLEEYSEVYVQDRSQPGALPEPAAKLLKESNPGPTTVVVARNGEEEADRIAVISAPSHLLLSTRLERRRNLPDLLKEPLAKDVLDLSSVGTTNLLIVGGGSNATPETLGSLHAQIARQMREKLGVAVEPRGAVLTQLESELAYQMARGATDTRGLLQRKYPTRYAWVFVLTSITGGTTFVPWERKLTASLAPFTDSEPTRPRRKDDEEDEDWRRRLRIYNDSKERWERANREWWDRYRNDSCEWELSVSWESNVGVRGLLQLVDTKTPTGAQVQWEKECSYTVSDKGWYRTQRATVKGHDNKPNSLEVPPANSQFAPVLLVNAAVAAGNQGVTALREEALLPDPARPAVTVAAVVASSDPMNPMTAPQPRGASAEEVNAVAQTTSAAPLVPKIAEIDGKTIILNIGAKQGVRVGDRYEVLLNIKETKDPDTGRVIRTRVLDSFFLTVTHVDEDASDCVALTAKDAARFKQTKAGVRVRRVTRAAPAPANIKPKG